MRSCTKVTGPAGLWPLVKQSPYYYQNETNAQNYYILQGIFYLGSMTACTRVAGSFESSTAGRAGHVILPVSPHEYFEYNSQIVLVPLSLSLKDIMIYCISVYSDPCNVIVYVE